MATFLRQMAVQHGSLVDSPSGDDEEDMYTTPAELNALYGCSVTEADIRAAMSLIAAHCNRASLWPVEYDTGPLEVPLDRQETRLPITPVIAITEAAGKYGMGRRDRIGWNMWQSGVAAYLVVAGSRPAWSPIDVSQLECDSNTGIVYVPPSWVLAPWAFVRMKFVAGLLTIPSRVKLGIFEIITNMHAKGVSDRVRYSVGRVGRTYANEGFITKTAASLLEPYRVQSLF